MADDIHTERFQMRVSADFLAKVDNWRREQPDLPNRSEAIRRLVEQSTATNMQTAIPPLHRLVADWFTQNPSKVESFGFSEGTTADKASTMLLSDSYTDVSSPAARLLEAFETEDDGVAHKIVSTLRSLALK